MILPVFTIFRFVEHPYVLQQLSRMNGLILCVPTETICYHMSFPNSTKYYTIKYV